MLRTIGAVVGGYLAIFLVVFATLSLAYMAMGADGAFHAGTYDVTPMWLIVSFILSFIAAVIGGLVAVSISDNPKVPMALAIVVVVLGLLSAIQVFTSDPVTTVRTADVGNMQAMMSARQPTWVAVLSPLIGALGVMVGARLKRRPAVVAQSV